ncbi:hypothetical protein KXW49_006073, partial [Aspergillus fumigatus]
ATPPAKASCGAGGTSRLRRWRWADYAPPQQPYQPPQQMPYQEPPRQKKDRGCLGAW